MYQDKLLFEAETVNLADGEYELLMQDHSYLSAHRFVPMRPQTQTNPADGYQSIRIAKKSDQQMKKFKVFRSLDS